MDSQQIELIGRNRLVNELLEAGLEVARPERDHGIDLIVYAEQPTFVAMPIQMKAASKESFNVDRKYEKTPNLLLVFIWNLRNGEEPATYALTYREAETVAETMGWTKTPSWNTGGKHGTKARGYGTRNPSSRLMELLKPFRMTPEKWREKITAAVHRQEGVSRPEEVMAVDVAP